MRRDPTPDSLSLCRRPCGLLLRSILGARAERLNGLAMKSCESLMERAKPATKRPATGNELAGKLFCAFAHEGARFRRSKVDFSTVLCRILRLSGGSLASLQCEANAFWRRRDRPETATRSGFPEEF